MRRRWSPTEDRMALDLAAAGASHRRIGKTLGRTHEAITKRIHRLRGAWTPGARPNASNPTNTLIMEVRERRITKNVSQEALSRQAGLSINALNLYERGRAKPNLYNFEAIVNALGGKLEIKWN